MRGEAKRESCSIGLQVGPAERGVVIVVDEERHIAQSQGLRTSGKGHEHDGHQHRQEDQQLVAPEQHEFFPSLSQDFLHSGISDRRDSMSEMNTSSRENGTGFLAVIRTPASCSTASASRFCSSFSVTMCNRSPNSETREAPNFFFNAAKARSG